MELDKKSFKKNIVIPLFPLPTTVFYPNTSLPLHIFEPRYCSMVADALNGKGEIGMILLKPGWESDYQGTPGIMTIGCLGKIKHHSELPEGKYNILLSGLYRFRILNEIKGKVYRQAQVEFLKEINDKDLTSEPSPIKEKLIRVMRLYLTNLPEGTKIEQTLDMKNCCKLGEFIDKLTHHFDLPVNKMQEFLEQQDVQKRADSLHSLIEFKNQLIQISKNMKDKEIDFSMN
ncbi:LON peptidase substrate-binding domain-containing protein [Nitrospinaceae bacterium]|nr:LON peptidase substrate-binding domain-containing protein [Nitrospinaceae bacterium]